MIWATLNPMGSVRVSSRTDRQITIEAMRDAGGPASGEPIRLTLTAEEAKTLVEVLQTVLKP